MTFSNLARISHHPPATTAKLRVPSGRAPSAVLSGLNKTPSLRNVALTPPYMHSGHFDTLTEVVRYYSKLDENPTVGHREEVLLPLELTDAEIADVVAFLESLTGELPPESLRKPPASPLP